MKKKLSRKEHLRQWLKKRGLDCCPEGLATIAKSECKSWRAYHKEHRFLYNGFSSWWCRVTTTERNFQNTGKGQYGWDSRGRWIWIPAQPVSKPLNLNSCWPFAKNVYK